MSTERSARQELRDRLTENPLEDADDLAAYIQYTSRLAALGDDKEFQKLPGIFERPAFAGNVVDILKTRCEQGIWEAEEYFGEELALSLMDAQDFYCFQRRMGDSFPAVKPWFSKWWDACEAAELDEAAAEMLHDFLGVYPIPEKELLPVVETPVTEFEYDLIDYLYAEVELPVVEMVWNTPKLRIRGKSDTPAPVAKLPAMISCDDDKPAEKLLDLRFSPDNRLKTSQGDIIFGCRLNKAWDFEVFIDSPVAVDRIRLGGIPAFQLDDSNPTRWTVKLKRFDGPKRQNLLGESVVIQLRNGWIIQCRF